MTNEEAKNLIDRWVVITPIEEGISLSERTRQALDMAIKALESCGDTISRDAVLDACSQSINILDAMSRIEDLPSVTPKQVPCGDAISRESLKSKLKEHRDFFVNAYGGFSNLPLNDKSRVDEIGGCIAMVIDEPTITPIQRTGHWIEHPEIETSAPEYIMFYECSECGDKQCFCKSNIHRKHFCNNCGAKMEEQA